TSRSARRIDALIVETYSTEDSYSVGLHGIEIKISKSDLKRDHKMQEYTDYCDYFWIAVPEELVDTAKDLIVDGWGILALDAKSGSISPVVHAKRHDAIFRDMTMSTALNKLI
ncbi:MmcB family DNA repair protein, partial [Terrisporobacter sp.]